MGKEKYKGRKYTVQEYDPNWVDWYNTESGALKKVLGDRVLSIKHVGSTSVPGLTGKPTLDILAIVERIESADQFVKNLKPLGYDFLGQYVMEGSRLYAKEKEGERLVNLHFFYDGHVHIDKMLKLRDYLRNHPEIVTEYSNFKFDLIKQYPNDYGSYREHKDEWMNALKGKLGLL